MHDPAAAQGSQGNQGAESLRIPLLEWPGLVAAWVGSPICLSLSARIPIPF